MQDSQESSTKVEWRESFEPCPVCGSARHKRLGRRGGDAHRAGLGAPTWVVRCRDCHLVYGRPRMQPVGNPYSGDTATDYFAGHESEHKRESGRRLIGAAEKHLGRSAPGNLLELGCGRGELLVAAAERGWSVYGVEMTPEFADIATRSGVKVEVAAVETAETLLKENHFDVVYLAAILEHVYDPIECLRRVHRALVPGGLVFIDVPNECSTRTKLGNLYMRLRGRDWAVNLSPTFPPFHVVGFCPRSLRRSLSLASLELIQLDVVTWRDMLPRQPGLWGRVEGVGSAAVHSLARLIGDGDGIACWARKPLPSAT